MGGESEDRPRTRGVLEELAVGVGAALARVRRTPEERLLRKARLKRRAWRAHIQSFVIVNAGLVAINGIIALASEGAGYPWSLVVLASWGIGLGLHTLRYVSWRRDNQEALAHAARADAAIRAGLEPPPPRPDSRWLALLERCRRAVDRARDALDEAGGKAVEVAELTQGLAEVERLAEHAARMQATLDEVSPGGARALERALGELEQRVGGATDEGLRAVYASNRGLLRARRDKVAQVEAELLRARETAEGFALAAENLSLDAARLGASALGEAGDLLREPLLRLEDEVASLREAQAEVTNL